MKIVKKPTVHHGIPHVYRKHMQVMQFQWENDDNPRVFSFWVCSWPSVFTFMGGACYGCEILIIYECSSCIL